MDARARARDAPRRRRPAHRAPGLRRPGARPPLPVWFPASIDLYVAIDDPEAARELLLACYRRFVEELHGVGAAVATFETDAAEEGEGDGAAATGVAAAAGVAAGVAADEDHAARRARPPSCGAAASRRPRRGASRRSRRARRRRRRPRCHPARVELPVPVGEPWAPTRLNVILTDAPPPPEAREAAASARTRYARWVTDGFDLAHCAIALDVDARTGAWRFEARERSCRALMARRLEALPECFARAGRCAASARRVLGALDLGFSLEGDGGWPDDAAARAALRAVA